MKKLILNNKEIRFIIWKNIINKNKLIMKFNL